MAPEQRIGEIIDHAHVHLSEYMPYPFPSPSSRLGPSVVAAEAIQPRLHPYRRDRPSGSCSESSSRW